MGAYIVNLSILLRELAMPQLNSARLPVATDTFTGGRLMPGELGEAPMDESKGRARGGKGKT